MQSIYKDHKLRAALHSIYVAQFKAIKAYGEGFTANDANRMMTSLMGSRPWSWRVVGITREALEIFAAHEFRRPPRTIQRGHRINRITTAAELYIKPTEPVAREQFFEIFLERDQTVLMTTSQNKHRPDGRFPDYSAIDQALELFPCGTLIGWKHTKREVNFLSTLYATNS